VGRDSANPSTGYSGHDFLQNLQDGPSPEHCLAALVPAGHRQVNLVAREDDLLDRRLGCQGVAEAHRRGKVEMQLPDDRGAYTGPWSGTPMTVEIRPTAIAPCAMRPPKRVRRASSSLKWMG